MNGPSSGMPANIVAPWPAFLALLGGAAINIMDITLVIVALPSIQADLGVDPARIGWVPAAYAVTFALALLPFGRIGDLAGRRALFLAGVASFAIASLLCAAAPSFETLVAARVVQGLAGAALVPQVMAMIPALFRPGDRPRAFALFATVGSLAAASGPLLGGVLVSANPYDLGWRTVFLADAVCAAVVLAAASRLVPTVPGHPGKTVDRTGTLLFALATLCIVLPLFEGPVQGWPAWAVGLLLIAIPFGSAFVLWQRHRARTNGPELLPFALLTEPRFVAGLGLVTLLFSGPPGLMLVLSVMFQTAFGLSPALAGLTMAPFPFGVMAGSLLAARFGSAQTGPRIAVGAAILTFSFLWLLLMLPGTGAATVGWLLPPLFVAGIGMGAAAPALFQSVMAVVPAGDSGVASGAAQTMQQLGAATGIAITGGLFAAALADSPQGGHAAAAAIAGGFPLAAISIVAVSTGLRALFARRTTNRSGETHVPFQTDVPNRR